MPISAEVNGEEVTWIIERATKVTLGPNVDADTETPVGYMLPHGITLTRLMGQDASATLWSLVASESATLNFKISGRLSFFASDGGSPYSEIEFDEAYVRHYEIAEGRTAGGQAQFHETVVLVPGTLSKDGKVLRQQRWPSRGGVGSFGGGSGRLG